MRQESMLEKIRKSSEQVPTPASLEPDQIMKMVDNRPPKRRGFALYGVAAALAVILLTSYGNYQRQLGSKVPTTAAGPEAAGEDGNDEAAAPLMASGLSEPMENQYMAKSYEDLYKQLQSLGPEDGAAPVMSRQMILDSRRSDSANAAGALSEAKELEDAGIGGLEGPQLLRAEDSRLYLAQPDIGVVRIIGTEGEAPRLLSEIPYVTEGDKAETVIGLYAEGNRLCVVYSQEIQASVETQEEEGAVITEDGKAQAVAEERTILDTYDLKDPSNPVLEGRIELDGVYKSSRMEGGILSLFTEYDVDFNAGEEEKSGYVPGINGKLLEPQEIYLPDVTTRARYLLIATVDIDQPGEPVDRKAVLSGGQQFYISGASIYAGNSKYNYDAHQYDYTELLKLSFEKGMISYKAHALIDGYLDSRFAMDEYNGYLRLISTVTQEDGGAANTLYVLDEGLGEVGSIQDLAPGDQICAARFIGDAGYFMTTQGEDTIYAVDLSDSANPRELKDFRHEKFPEYLGFLGSGGRRLLGIGRMELQEENGASGFRMTAFDVSDTHHIRRLHEIVEVSYDYSEAWYHPQSVFQSVEGDLIGLSVELYGEQPQNRLQEYVVYSYGEEEGFQKRLEHVFDDGGVFLTRGVRQGDRFYIAGPQGVSVFSCNDFSLIGQLLF